MDLAFSCRCSFPLKPPCSLSGCCVVVSEKSRGCKQRPWVVFFLWTQTAMTQSKVVWQEKSSFLSARPASPLFWLLVCGCCSLWSWPHTYWRGFWGIHQCALFLSLPLIYIWVSGPFFIPFCICLFLSKNYFYIPGFDFCFSLCHKGHLSFSHHSECFSPSMFSSICFID